MDNYNILSDSELVTLLKRRDRSAFAEIYDRYSMMIYYKINQMLRDENVSKDLVQDLFTSIWEKSELIRDNVGISSYLYVAARNRVLKYIQKGKTRSDYLAEIGKYSLMVSDETLEKIDEKDLMLLLTAEIAKLPAKMREVFELSRLEDLSHREIAQRLGLSESTVKKQVQNALKILKVRLSRYHSLGVILLIFLRDN
ncbi:RNA polymerase sigma-70 factor [Sphingobacterium thalpophilum]|uniref:RNA polymerase sigma-70 factor n=1 Tax=Sphingobacterium thalpophilum TaxID=259 RepID=A0A4V6KVZ3_9SPHI|nr:RNA polymerase sigma-70 factor [Sphingobacterium thalpophilum]VTR48988.1 Sigma-K factor [Sphingobacterium thalpophilum]